MELLRVFEGLGPDMGSRTYEKGQELLLFLHAGGKAPVLGEISKNVKIIEFLENDRISIDSRFCEFYRNSQKSKKSLFSCKKHTFTKPCFSLGNIGVSASVGTKKRKITKFH